MDSLERAASWLQSAERVVVLTGAGISTDSGIPDFRGPNGVWTKNPAAEKQATLRHYLDEPDVRRASWQVRLHSTHWTARPNDSHHRVVDLERAGRLHALVTQNVDGLHQLAGQSPDLVVEVHGTMHRTLCWACRDVRPMAEALDRVRSGDVDPPCLVCGGILKSDTISFGQALVPEVIERALRAAEEADVLLTIGTSLQVYPVANMVPRAKAAGAAVIVLNGEPTKQDHRADAVLHGPIAELLPALIDGVGPIRS